MEVAFGILGSIASVVGLLLPASGVKQRFIHCVYGLAIIVLAYTTVSYQETIDRVASIERTATKMVMDHNGSYTNLGFVHASLAFLEKNRDLYPDTYARALKMCAQYKCDSPEGDSVELVTLSFTMRGLLKGLATQNNDSSQS
jgi:hypothetical protein